VVLGLKGQGHRVNKCIFKLLTKYAYVNAHLTGFELCECLLVVVVDDGVDGNLVSSVLCSM